MSTYANCDTCGRLYWTDDRHECPPIFLCWSPEYGHTADGDGRRIHARDAEQAATAWAEWYDRHTADYPIVCGSDATVHVRDPEGKERLFVVTGEHVPVYSARAAKGPS